MNAPQQGQPPGSARPHDDALGLPWLVADVGGTNARFGWVEDPALGVRHVRQLAVAQHASPADAAAAYLDSLRQPGAHVRPAPRRAALAVATAVGGDQVSFTNSPWGFSRTALREALGVGELQVLNDFEALALSLPRLGPHQMRTHGAAPHPRGMLAVIGPGTGLGVAAVVQTPLGWQALAGEGGHATLAAADDFEAALLRHVRQRHAHVSAERLLSGIGLPVLHEAVAAVRGEAAQALEAPQIVERAVAGTDAACAHTIEAFCALLGSFAGNVALTYGARGGVYIGGGIVPRLGELFFGSRFRERFEAKGRFQPYLQAIPTALITDTQVALTGAAAALEQSAT
ncbi:MAG: glucokinase [Pseudomonadota bacterium]|jgi:glucokinase